MSGSAEAALTPAGLGGGDFVANFGTLTETLYYDPNDSTLQADGTVTLSPYSGSISISGTRVAPGTGSASLTLGNNGVVSFDMSYQFSGEFDNVYDHSSALTIPATGSGTFNGEHFSGSWNLQIPINLMISAANPTSITFSESSPNGAAEGSVVVPGSDLEDANNDTTYEYSWRVSGEATTVPEPPALVLIAMTLLPLAVLRRVSLRHQS